MFALVFGFLLQVIPVIPSLVTDIEKLWSNKPQSGSQKWIAVEQALSQSIADVATQAAQIAPAGTKAEEISAAVAIFSKAVNDASVTLFNTLQIFPHAGQPAANAVAIAPVKQ